jgi:hypothetical protein
VEITGSTTAKSTAKSSVEFELQWEFLLLRFVPIDAFVTGIKSNLLAVDKVCYIGLEPASSVCSGEHALK